MAATEENALPCNFDVVAWCSAQRMYEQPVYPFCQALKRIEKGAGHAAFEFDAPANRFAVSYRLDPRCVIHSVVADLPDGEPCTFVIRDKSFVPALFQDGIAVLDPPLLSSMLSLATHCLQIPVASKVRASLVCKPVANWMINHYFSSVAVVAVYDDLSGSDGPPTQLEYKKGQASLR
jgi:hypothetical protein